MMTEHSCELRDAGGYSPPDKPGTRCDHHGFTTFYRDPAGWGHWLCIAHRDAERAAVARFGYGSFTEAEEG